MNNPSHHRRDVQHHAISAQDVGFVADVRYALRHTFAHHDEK